MRRADFVYVNGDHLMIMFVLAPVNGGVAKVAGAVLGGILTGSLGWPCVFHVALAAPARVPLAAAVLRRAVGSASK